MHPAPTFPERPLSALSGTRGQPGHSRRQAPGGGEGGGPGADGGPQQSPPCSRRGTCSRGPSHSESHLGASGSLSGTQQRQDWTNPSSQLHRVAGGRSRCLASCPPAQPPPGGVPPAPDASLLLGNGLKGPAGMHPCSFSHSPTPDGPPRQGAETASQGALTGSAGPLCCPPSPRAAGRDLLEAPPPRSGQDRGSRGGPATPTLPQAGPCSTQHGVPSARLPGPRAHSSFHGWRSGRWGWALPRGWRANGYRTWQGQGPARPLGRVPRLSKQSQGPAPTGRAGQPPPSVRGQAGSAGSLRQLLFHPPAMPLHRPSGLQGPPPSGPGNCPRGSQPSPGRPLPTQPASADPQAAATPGPAPPSLEPNTEPRNKRPPRPPAGL